MSQSLLKPDHTLPFPRFPSSSGLLVAAMVWAVYLPASANQLEPDKVTIKSSQFAAKNLLVGPHHRVAEEAVTEGHMNQYTISSDFGPFMANGDEHLGILVREIEAIAELQKISKSEAFAEAMVNAATRPIEMVQKVAEQPVETVKQIPQGIGRLLKRTARVVSDTAESVQALSTQQNGESGGENSTTNQVVEKGTKFTKDQLGVNRAVRKLAKELNVDPYSTNEVLQKEMGSVAWVMAGGSLATGELMPSMPDEIGQLSDLNNLVWETDPLDLRLRNDEILSNMGADQDLIKALYDNNFYTTTMRTRLIGSLNALQNADGRTILVADAAEAESRTEARIYRQIAESMVAYEKSRSPITKLFSSEVLPLALTKQGTIVLFVPVDHLRWTKNVDSAVKTLAVEINRAGLNTSQEIWVRGKTSNTAQSALSANGWKVFDQSETRLH